MPASTRRSSAACWLPSALRAELEDRWPGEPPLQQLPLLALGDLVAGAPAGKSQGALLEYVGLDVADPASLSIDRAAGLVDCAVRAAGFVVEGGPTTVDAGSSL